MAGGLRGWAEKYGKPLLMSEYGADAMPGLHSVWDMPWTEEYQTGYLAADHRAFDRPEAVIGEHVWNFAYFATSEGTHRVDGNRKGVFTRDRRPQSAATRCGPAGAACRGGGQVVRADTVPFGQDSPFRFLPERQRAGRILRPRDQRRVPPPSKTLGGRTYRRCGAGRRGPRSDRRPDAGTAAERPHRPP